MSQLLPVEKELLSAQIRNLWRRTAEASCTEKEAKQLSCLLAHIAPRNDVGLVDAAATRFAGEMHDPNPEKAQIARYMLLMFFEGILDLAAITEEGEFLWAVTDAAIEAGL